jgi:hypothetical protein
MQDAISFLITWSGITLVITLVLEMAYEKAGLMRPCDRPVFDAVQCVFATIFLISLVAQR